MAEWISWICDAYYFPEGVKEYLESEVEENMLPEICSCGYRFETDETICPNCGKKVEEDG